MTPNRNRDESEDPKSSTASASKPEGEDGRWLPPTLDRLPALTAVFASWSLVVSVAYDWGFFFALGIRFAHAPTTLSDHLSSWLVWATLYTPIPVAYVIYLMIRFRRQVRAAPPDREGDDEVTSSVPPIFQRTRLFYRICFWIFPVLFLAWLLFGTPKNRAQDDALPRAYVRLGAGDPDSGSVVEEAYVLRSFANWLLVQDQDRTQVDWVRMEQVDRIEVPPDGGFPGLLCGICGLWCRGGSGVNPTSSLPDGTDGDPHEPTLAIDPRGGIPLGIHGDAVG